jgi:hypothetical protein
LEGIPNDLGIPSTMTQVRHHCEGIYILICKKYTPLIEKEFLNLLKGIPICVPRLLVGTSETSNPKMFEVIEGGYTFSAADTNERHRGITIVILIRKQGTLLVVIICDHIFVVGPFAIADLAIAAIITPLPFFEFIPSDLRPTTTLADIRKLFAVAGVAGR